MIHFQAMTTAEQWDWIRARAFPIMCIDTCGIVCYQDEAIIAAAVFDTFGPSSCNVHFAIEKPIAVRRGFLNEIARFLFVDRGRDRIFGYVPATNTRAYKFDTHLGMREVSRIPDGYDTGIDYIVLCMEKDECRWLNSPKTAVSPQLEVA